jgi:Zn-dependent protease
MQRLAEEAQAAEAALDSAKAIEIWQSALSLLPPAAGQRLTIAAHIARLEALRTSTVNDDAEVIAARSSAWKKWLGALAPVVAILLTKGKFVLLGLTKLPTLGSMFLFVSVYWKAWGWAFAVGFVLCIYVHEMGHMLMFRRYGVASSNPFFIPGFGAIIFSKGKISDPRQDAHIGLGGPVAGLVAALICLGLYAISRNELFLALTVIGALINLFNLIPILFLDGARALRGLGQMQRWAIAGVALVCALVFSSKVALGIALVLVGRMLVWTNREEESVADTPTVVAFAVLLVSLSALASIAAPSPQDLKLRMQSKLTSESVSQAERSQ